MNDAPAMLVVCDAGPLILAVGFGFPGPVYFCQAFILRCISSFVIVRPTAVEKAQTPQEIPTFKKLRGERNYFRIRIGDYRLGLKIEGQLVTLVRILNRKEIYRYFP